MTVLARPAGTSVRVELNPSATAMVWMAVDRQHEAVAFVSVQLAPGEVLVEVELATICGSDVHTARGHRSAPAPLVLGHEQVGRVVALGATPVVAVDGSPVRVGDRVLWSIAASCGDCDRCRSGRSQKCRTLRKYGHERIEDRWALSGGFATHTHLLAGTPIVRVPDDIPAAVLAPVSCGTATAFAALAAAEQIRALEGAEVLISGAGLIGLTATAMAVDRGASVTVVDPGPARRDLARRFGAAQALAPGTATGEFDVVLEASGSAAAVATSFASAGIGGVVVLVGSVSPSEAVALDPERVVRSLLTIRGVHNYAPLQLAAATDYVIDRWRSWPFAELVGDTVPLDHLDDGIRRAGVGGPVRIAVSPR
ncbi:MULTISPECIES: alcohol dehydrogenase catalytic domain-containing protein [unclassified Rathayibacter]|uniref:alcohol dehydrogenase catalytic domain-containing protein n=1 Tax=unclassified Rathayibacter TaxID=2609250 RepID=UPI000CE8D55B|nr:MULTISPECIES: alcohol dehydrogenase catalytic domain-containing protein [unclassified Rathayibacter]PPG79656.1 alcohol dehydrogenase [Rathayibacter sp. AY1E5]PPH32889.1 alcohol dehydrogenase [Rathayibacter sp. AY1C3]PPH65623.1 alcohol dehydrogenase [Rathayibacter sp. AY1D7]PPI28807.1 alcohol dehydrogenase [Rathayibacter sp. AY1B4]